MIFLYKISGPGTYFDPNEKSQERVLLEILNFIWECGFWNMSKLASAGCHHQDINSDLAIMLPSPKVLLHWWQYIHFRRYLQSSSTWCQLQRHLWFSCLFGWQRKTITNSQTPKVTIDGVEQYGWTEPCLWRPLSSLQRLQLLLHQEWLGREWSPLPSVPNQAEGHSTLLWVLQLHWRQPDAKNWNRQEIGRDGDDQRNSRYVTSCHIPATSHKNMGIKESLRDTVPQCHQQPIADLWAQEFRGIEGRFVEHRVSTGTTDGSAWWSLD